MIYISYEKLFGIKHDPNVGLLLIVTLLIMLVFFELSYPLLNDMRFPRLQYLRLRFTNLTLILFIIFLGMILIKIVALLND